MHIQVTDILPPIAFVVSYLLQRDTWPKQINMLLAAGTIILVVVLDLLIQGQLTGNPVSDLPIIVTATFALQAETFIPLQHFLRNEVLTSKNGAPDTKGNADARQTILDENKRSDT